MEKRRYTAPEVEIHNLTPLSLLTLSADGNRLDFLPDPVDTDADEAASPLFEWMSQLLLLVMLSPLSLLFAPVAASAQSTTIVQPANAPADGLVHAMTLYMLDGTTHEFSVDDIDNVTYLPDIGIKVYVKGSATSVDYLYSQMTKIEYGATIEPLNVNANSKSFDMEVYTYAYRIEYPHLDSNQYSSTTNPTGNQVIVKETQDYGITYSLEWDNGKIANRWTCYTLHAGNTLSVVDRNDDFKADPDCAVSATLDDYSGSGFSRGHLCPSADRLCSNEQNKQTFFLSNMQPQYQKHNGGLWSRMETLVRNFATNDSYTGAHCDTLYVVKAATISDEVTIGDTRVDGVYAEKCNDRLLIPKYFYMALLHYNKETDTYQAIGLWTEHLDITDSNPNLGDYAISIDELEKRTGIDFFCNLPDEVEDAVEQTFDLSFWKLTTTN